MTKIRDLYEYIDSFAPFRSAMSFDNVGLLVGDGEREVTKVLVSLDITRETVAEAAALGAELIVSHHPVIFEPLRTLAPGDVPYELAKVGIAAICAHTNLDLSESFGVNTCLAAAVGIELRADRADPPGHGVRDVQNDVCCAVRDRGFRHDEKVREIRRSKGKELCG